MFNEFTRVVHNDVYPAIDPSTTLSGTMRGKNVFVTGGGRGIGRAIAQSFAKAGARGVFLVSRTEEYLQQSQKVIKAEFPDILVGYFAGNIAHEATVAEMFRSASEMLGPLDVLVNCAGQSEHYQPLADIPVATWWGSIETNLLGTFLISKYFLNQPSPSSRRVIINVGSNSAVEPIVIQYQCPSGYTVGKTGFVRIVQYLHTENTAKGINSYLIHPGAVLTHLLEEYMPPGSAHAAIDSPNMAGGLAVWFASELNDSSIDRAWLGGRYISAKWDVDELLERKDEITQKDLFRMRLDM